MKSIYSDKIINYLARKGGLLEIEAYDGNLHLILSTFQKRIEHYIQSTKEFCIYREAPKIQFGFINNPELNAVAIIAEDDEYFIGINAGTVIIIYDIFYRMLSYTNLLPQIGDPKQETLSEPSLRSFYLDADLMITCGDPDYKTLKLLYPKDDTRRHYANHLVSIAIDFLIAHEVTHVLNGHLCLIKSKFSKSHYYETSNTDSREEILLRQVLEMDADTVGATRVISNLLRHHSEQQVSEQFNQLYQDPNTLLQSYAFSILSILRIMAESPNYDTVPINSLTHPFPRVRSHIILCNLIGYIRKDYPAIYTKLSTDLIIKIFLEVELAHKAITGIPVDKVKITKEITYGAQQASDFLERWKEVRPSLLKFTYVDLVE